MVDNTEFDLVVIGGGPGGYVAAIKAAQLGQKVACVENRGALGGTCLNVGCIPSKAMLESSHLYVQTKEELGVHGIKVSEVSLNLDETQKRRVQVVTGLTKGIEGLFKKNKVTYLKGLGSLVSPQKIKVQLIDGGEKEISAKNIILATGSEPIPLPIAPFDGHNIISSTEALELTEVPKHLVVIGGGVIGLEIGSIWLRFGAKVTIIEATPSILPGMDKDIQNMARRLFEKQGFSILTGAKVSEVLPKNNDDITIKFVREDKTEEIKASKVLVCVGRRPFSRGLGLDALDIKCDERGRVITDQHYRTNIPGIYAIGDLIKGPMLAHKAEEEGVAVAEYIAKGAGHVNYRAIPSVVYTFPEIATLGLSEDDCKNQNIAIKIGKFPFAANGRAKTAAHIDGFVKIIADAKTDKMLGFHIIGAQASELIAEAVMVFEFEGSAEDMARSVHAHPTLSEALKEAAMDVSKTAIHF